jgi:hypothetical protein
MSNKPARIPHAALLEHLIKYNQDKPNGNWNEFYSNSRKKFTKKVVESEKQLRTAIHNINSKLASQGYERVKIPKRSNSGSVFGVADQYKLKKKK